MDVLDINELVHLTRELCILVQRIEHTLKMLEPGTIARTNALTSLANIRRVMRVRGFHF